jgi:putative FmdB family regulatory protein
MPLYEVFCSKCNILKETRCSYKDYKDCVIECPKCNEYMDKIVSSGGFKLKGEGFYAPYSDTEESI